jgi:hypothetical protein
MVSSAVKESVQDYKDEFSDYEGFIENIDYKKHEMYQTLMSNCKMKNWFHC